MIIHLVNQQPITVSDETGNKAIAALKAGADYITVDGEYIKSTSIASIRNDEQRDRYVLWGSSSPSKLLEEHAKRNFTDEGLRLFKQAREKIGI